VVVRSVVLFIGDLSMQGTRPSSELAAINPSYDDPQTDAFIWNDGASAWQNYQAGTNSAPSGSFWGPEARFREGIRPNKPTGNLYYIKHAVDSSMASMAGKVSWNPLVTGEAYSALVAKIAAAAAAAAPDTLRIEACVLSIYTEDIKLPEVSRCLGVNTMALIEALRRKIPTISGCSLGSLINGTGFMPAYIIEPCHTMTGLSEADYLQTYLSRGTLHCLEDNSVDEVVIHRTSRYAVAADGKTFNAASLVAMGEDLGRSVFYSPPTYTTTEEPMFIVMGDSIHEGTGVNSEMPPQLLGPLPGAAILSARSAKLETLQAGVNNQVTLPPVAGLHGIEIPLCGLLQAQLKSLTVVKATWVGSRTFMWHPVDNRYFWHGMVKTWLLAAIDQLKAANKKPILKFVAISLGTNDILDPAIDLATTRANIEAIIDGIKNVLARESLPTSQIRFYLALPSETISADPNRIAAARNGLTAMAETRTADVRLVDLTGLPTVDSIHLSTVGNSLHALNIFNAWKNLSLEWFSVAPTFAPSRELLVKALRLSAVRQENDGHTMIDTAIQDTAIGFRGALGSERVASLAALPFVPNPTTDIQHLRMLAYQTEIKWVRSKLLRSMPTLFMDGTARLQTWNDEAAFRETSYLSTRDELRRLEEEISQALETLKSANLAPPGSSLSVQTVQPDERIFPGDTVRAI